MTTKLKAPPARGESQQMAAADLRTRLVKEQREKANALFEANTLRLKALRLAKEAADKATVVSHPAPPKPKRKRVT